MGLTKLPGRYFYRLLKVIAIPLLILILVLIGTKSLFQRRQHLDVISAQGLVRGSSYNIKGRQLKDYRSKRCTDVDTGTGLPSASVIITCTNTDQSILFGTIRSVVQNSPVEYLKEIIVAPFNKQTGLEEIKASIRDTWPDGMVRVISPENTLYRARKNGAKKSTGEVLVFMNSRCLVTKGWLEPLLAAIGHDPKLVAAPVIGRLGDVMMPGFLFNFTLAWRHLTDAEASNLNGDPTQQIKIPVISGEVFAANQENFANLGGFQDEMFTVGFELEFSLRTWMCGGAMAMIPCSKVHILAHEPILDYKVPLEVEEKAMIQIAEVWMDEYRRMFYMYRKRILAKPYGGDLAQKHLMERRKECRPFSWYLENVYSDKFLPDENVYSWGLVRNPTSFKCLTSEYSVSENTSTPVRLVKCDHGGNMDQTFSFTFDGTVRQEESRCLASTGDINSSVYIADCNTESDRILWEYTMGECILVHRVHSLCLTAVDATQLPVLQPCVEHDKNATIAIRQKWTFQHYLKKELKFWE